MYAGSFAIPYDALDIGLRLMAATLIGMALGWSGCCGASPPACAPWAWSVSPRR